MIKQSEILLPAFPRGFHLITPIIAEAAGELPGAGLINVFIHHTSAGICINENADPTVREDFETVFNRLVPENSRLYVHDCEGSDDMPAHIKSALTGQSITIPVSGKRIKLGSWQGIYLCEFRNWGGRRRITITVWS
jgi:secondary thiamine-phosphate synthase enzyme